jgi:hypothetical protein
LITGCGFFREIIAVKNSKLIIGEA